MYKSIIILICLSINVSQIYGGFEDRPTYGYHLKIGVPKALKLRTATSRIVGGSAVNAANSIPHQAGIVTTLTNGWTSVCGGSIISDTRILTAAHCWWDGESQARLFTVVLGSLTIFSGGTRIDTTNVRVHPQWTTDMIHDIAVAVITKVTFNNNIQAIALPSTSEVNLDFVGSAGVISGFGKTSDAQNGFPTTTALHQTTVSVITNAVCQNSFRVKIDKSHICVSGAGGKGTCDGDSGGPLTVLHNNRRILIGVVSFGPNDGCQVGQPSVFTRVTSYLAWIQATL